MKPKHSKAFSRALACTILIAAVLAWGFGVFPQAERVSAQPPSQADGLTMTVTPAFTGYFKYGEWLPIWVELENNGGDLDASIRVPINSSQGTLVFETPVQLPSGSRKLVPIYVLPNNFSRELDVQLTSGGKLVTNKKATIRPQPNITYIIGLLAPERGALSLLNGVTFPGQERTKVLVDLSLDELPERDEGLRSFDLIILNDLDTTKLTPDQSAALVRWVQRGGRLVLGGGANAQRTAAGLPADLLPVRFGSSTELTSDALKPLAVFANADPILTGGSFVAARGETANGETLVGDSAFPLVQEAGYGAGVVDVIALDLAGVPFNGWPGTQSFWTALIGAAGRYPDNMPFDMSPRQYRANSLTYSLSNIPSLDLPSIKGLSILLGIYMLIVGPVNYLVLRWRKRLHLAWVTIPAVTALFTAGAFGIGYAMRGNDLILNKIALIETRANGPAGVTSYMGLFSPRMQSYEVTVNGEGLTSPMNTYDPGPWSQGAPTTGGEMVFVQGQPSRVRGLTVNQWAMQSFLSEGSWKDFGKFTSKLEIQNETLVGTVKNDTGYPVTDVVVVMQSRFVRLGDMAAGEEKAVNMGLSNMQNDRFGTPISYRLYMEGFNTGPAPRINELKTNIISSLFENGPWMKTMSSLRAPGSISGDMSGGVVFGWLDQAPPTVEVPDNRLTQKTTALVYSTLEYNLPQSGFVTIPAGLIPGKISKVPVDSGNCGVENSIHMMKGSAEFEYQLPSTLKNVGVNTLKLAIWRDSGNQVAMPAFALFDWKNSAWTNIQEPIQGTNVIQNAAPYVNENGLVRVQVTTSGDTMGCIYLDLGIEAQRQAKQGD